jgi:hypothetical protein
VQADTVADIEPAAGTVQAGPGRKLLAAMGSKAASFVGMSSGTTAREIEAREIAGINGQSPAATEEKTAWMKEQIAALEAEKRDAAEGQVAAFSNEQASLKSKEEKIQKTRDAKMAALSQSPEDKALKASLVAQQAKLAEVSAEKQRLSEELTQKLDATQTEYERRIAALEGERNDLRQQRDELKQQVASLAAEKARIEPRVSMEMASNETIKQAVMAGMGLSFLSLHTLGLELDNRLIAVLDVEGAPVVRAWNVVHMLSKLLSPAAEAFRYFVLENGEDHLAQQFARHINLGPINSGLIAPSGA